MITEYMRNTASALVDILNSKIPDYGSAFDVMNALWWAYYNEEDYPAAWAKEIEIDGKKWDLTQYQQRSSHHTSSDLSRYFVIPFMGGDIAIGIGGEIYNGGKWYDKEISYGLVKYEPYYSKGLK